MSLEDTTWAEEDAGERAAELTSEVSSARTDVWEAMCRVPEVATNIPESATTLTAELMPLVTSFLNQRYLKGGIWEREAARLLRAWDFLSKPAPFGVGDDEAIEASTVWHGPTGYRGGDVARAPCGVDIMDRGAPVRNTEVLYGKPGQKVTCPRCLAAAMRGAA